MRILSGDTLHNADNLTRLIDLWQRMAQIHCLSCGYDFSAGEYMKAQYRGKNLVKNLFGVGRKALFCPRCDVEGKQNFVCAECGQYHVVRPGPCKRVNR